MRVIVIGMSIMLIAGMTAWLIIFQSYSWLIHDTQKKEHRMRLVKQIIYRYDTCKKLDISVNNMQAFLENMIADYTVFGLKLFEWQKFAKGMKRLVIATGLSAALVLHTDIYRAYICLAVAILSVLSLQLMEWLTNIKDLHAIFLKGILKCLDEPDEGKRKVEVLGPMRLTRRAALEFSRLKRCYEKMESAIATGTAGGGKLAS